MSRDIATDMAAEVVASSLRPVMFYEGEFAADTLRLWTGVGSKSWNGYTWTGLGNLIAITPIRETTSTEATGFQISVTGESSSHASRALQSCRQNKPGKLWLGALTAAGAVVADPVQVRAGKLSHPEMSDDGKQATITVVYEDELTDLERARERRYTSEDQALDYPDDRGFDFVPQLQDASLVWTPDP
jgi:hypothetical protein